jgi:hypothetical protein
LYSADVFSGTGYPPWNVTLWTISLSITISVFRWHGQWLGYGLKYPGFGKCRGIKFSPPTLRDPLQGTACILLGGCRERHAGLWHPSSRVQTRPKPSDYSGEKVLNMPSFVGKVKPSNPYRSFAAC